MFLRFNIYFWQSVWHLKSVFSSLILMIIAAAILIAYTESMEFDNALYFAFVTGLTIGYGDIVPSSAAGRIVSSCWGLSEYCSPGWWLLWPYGLYSKPGLICTGPIDARKLYA